MGEKIEIPKYIHYCWFGGKPLPHEYEKYIQTWKRFFPNYEIIRWDENNFPISEIEYAKEAYEENKMAFVSDVARIYALDKMGGIYFDTDVEVIKCFDEVLLEKSAVLGTETIGETIGTGFMAFTKNHPICQKMMEYYRTHSFKNQDNMMSNTQILASLLKNEYNLKPRGKIQTHSDIIIYPPEYFTAFNGYTGKNEITNHTYCVHHFAASWFSPYRKFKEQTKRFLHRCTECLKRQR